MKRERHFWWDEDGNMTEQRPERPEVQTPHREFRPAKKPVTVEPGSERSRELFERMRARIGEQ